MVVQKTKENDMPPSTITIEEISDTQSFKSLRETWNALLDRCADNNLFLTWEWLYTWWKHYGSGKRLRIMLVKDQEEIIGIGPFMQTTFGRGPGRVNMLENICGLECDYSGIIFGQRSHDVIYALTAYLRKLILEEGLVFRGSQVPETSVFFEGFKAYYPTFQSSCTIKEEHVSICPYMELPETWQKYLGDMKSRSRWNLRRHVKALEKYHKIGFDVIDKPEDIARNLEALFDQHCRRWETKKLPSKFHTTIAREFYLEVSELLNENNWLYFTVLTADQQPISIVWGFNYQDTYWYMTPTFDPNYSNYSVGTVHLLKLLESVISKGIRYFDFLKGDSSYKNRWTPKYKRNYQISVTKKGVIGSYRIWLFNFHRRWEYIKTHSFTYLLRFLLYNIILKRKDIPFD